MISGKMVPRGGIEPPTLRFSVALYVFKEQSLRRTECVYMRHREQQVSVLCLHYLD